MSTKRFAHGCAVLDGKLYALGGYYDGDFLSLVERYDPATNTWEAVASMSTARLGHGCAVVDGKLYALGGKNGHRALYLSSVERYDPATNAWEGVASMGGHDTVPLFEVVTALLAKVKELSAEIEKLKKGA